MNKKLCRLCLSNPSVCFSLLENNLPEMLESLTAIKVDANKIESTITCMKCLLNLKLAFKIQQNFIKAESKLKDLDILNNVEVKVEVETQYLKVEMKESKDPSKICSANCMICGIIMENNLLAQHIQDHFSDIQTCDCCKKTFGNINEYKTHLTQTNCTITKTECAKCGVTFRYKSLYNLHMKKAHQDCDQLSFNSKKAVKLEPKPNLNSPFTCEICCKQFQFKRQLLGHSHLKKKCPICTSEISKSNFKKHLLNHSSGPQICEICGASLRSLESLRGHISHTHSNVSYKCEECGKVFNKKYPFLLHKKKHSGEKAHVCETCGKAFLTFFYLNKHIKTAHLKLRPYICEYCQKGFSSKFALRTHIRQHTNETPYKCEICGEGFRQNVSLRAHRKSKHNIIEAKNCACPVCGKLFSSEQAILSHMRLH